MQFIFNKKSFLKLHDSPKLYIVLDKNFDISDFWKILVSDIAVNFKYWELSSFGLPRCR